MVSQYGKLLDWERENTLQTTNIRNETDVAIDLTELERIMKECCGQLYTKIDNLEEIGKFYKMHNLLKLTQEGIENLKDLYWIERLIQFFKKEGSHTQEREIRKPYGFTGEFHQMSK